MTRTIRPGVPNTLRDLNAALGKADRIVFDLHIESPPEAFDQAADALYAAFELARTLARSPSVTGCERHPQGAIDPLPPDGWGKCLLCNDHRRRATRPATPTPTRPGPPPAKPAQRPTPPDLEAERRRQLNALETLIADASQP